MKKKFVYLIFICLSISTQAEVIDNTSYPEASSTEDYFAITEAGSSTPLFISSSYFPGVIRAFVDLQDDVFKLTGKAPELKTDTVPASSDLFLAGTLEKSLLRIKK